MIKTVGTVLAALVCVLVNAGFAASMPNGGEVAHGRLAVGILLQLAGIALVGGVPRKSREPGVAAAERITFAALAGMIIPALVLMSMGTGLVYGALLEGHLPLPYRGGRSLTWG